MVCSTALDDCDIPTCCLSKNQTHVREADVSGRAGLHAPGLASPHTDALLPLPLSPQELQGQFEHCSQSSSEQEKSGQAQFCLVHRGLPTPGTGPSTQ